MTAIALLGLSAAACDTDSILDVTDPDIIDPQAVRDSSGAEALRIGALARFNTATSGGESFFLYGGLLADEFLSSDTFSQRNETDQRRVQNTNANINTAYRDVHRARLAAQQAADGLREFAASRTGQLGEMYLVQAYTENMLGENFCSGVPFSRFLPGGGEEYGTPTPTAEIFQRAIAHADSAVAAATGTGALAVSVRNASAIVKARALVNLGEYAAAATAVAGIPTSYAYVQEQSQSSRDNTIWNWNNNQRRWSVANNEGGNGLNFIAAADPRLPTQAPVPGGGFDAGVTLVRQLAYPTRETSFAIITGVEARLIEAEAQLQAGNTAGMLATLNALRAAPQPIGGITPTGLAPLTDAGTAVGRQDQLFRERAFWMYASGHRLGDLRRLIRQYGRSEATVFPTGAYFKGGTYGTDVNFPVTQAEENNSNFVGCLNRDA